MIGFYVYAALNSKYIAYLIVVQAMVAYLVQEVS